MNCCSGSALRGLLFRPLLTLAIASLLAGTGCATLQAQRVMGQAEAAAATGNHESAHRLYSSALQSSPGNASAQCVVRYSAKPLSSAL